MNSNYTAAIGFIFIWLALVLDYPILFAVILLILVIFILLTNKIYCRKFLEKFYKLNQNISKYKKSIKITAISINYPIFISRPILEMKIFQKIQRILGKQIESQIRLVGKPANSLNIIKKSMSFSVFFAIIVNPIALMLGIFVAPIFFVLMIGPIWIFLYPKISLSFAKSKREKLIKHELAYFTKYTAIMQSVEKTLYYSLIEIIDNELFEIIETDAKMAYRNVTIFAMDTFEVLNDIALHHPNKDFQSFLLSYIATAQTGGDLTNLMEQEAESFFDSLKEDFKRYLGNASTFGEILLIILLILPTFLIATSFLLPGSSITLLLLVSVIGIPMLSIFLIVMIDSTQPRNLNKIKIVNLAFVGGISVAIIMLVLHQSPWLLITSGILVFAVINTLKTRTQFGQIKEIENALPEFLRDITEYRKIGYDITMSLYRIFGTRKYNKHFDELLRIIYAQLKSGATLSSITNKEERSWIIKLILFILGKLADTGGGTALTLEHFTRFVSEINNTKKSTVSALRMQMLLVYIGPIIMVFVAKTSISLLTKISSNLPLLNNWGIETFVITPEFVDVINIVIAISSLAMGFVFTKISLFTLKDTKNVIVTAMIVIISILSSPYIPSIL